MEQEHSESEEGGTNVEVKRGHVLCGRKWVLEWGLGVDP